MEVLIVVIISIVYRAFKCKPLFARSCEAALYKDTWRSGHAFNIFQVIGGARNSLWIEVTQERVSIHPHFPFSLVFLPEIWGCEWDFDKKDLVSIEDNVLGVVVTFKYKNQPKQFRISPSDKTKFIEAVKA